MATYVRKSRSGGGEEALPLNEISRPSGCSRRDGTNPRPVSRKAGDEQCERM